MIARISAAVAALLVSTAASAGDTTQSLISSVYVGDDGAVNVTLANGCTGGFVATHPSKNDALATLLTARALGRPVVLRYAATLTTCAATTEALQGVLML